MSLGFHRLLKSTVHPRLRTPAPDVPGTAYRWAPISIFFTWPSWAGASAAVDEYGSWEGPASSILACTVIVSFAKGLRKSESAFVVVEMILFSCQEMFQSSIWMDRECYLNEIL